jgi:uncharacterized membrane protein YbaN (DUF454 family)
MTTKRIIWFCLGGIALVLAVIGLALPLLPTTPFLILAAYAFARSSERWHQWLVNHDLFGPMITNWNRYGAIGRPAKMAAILSLIAVFCISLALGVGPIILTVQGLVLITVGGFIISRPNPPE